jgi:hypothetical protein
MMRFYSAQIEFCLYLLRRNVGHTVTMAFFLVALSQFVCYLRFIPSQAGLMCLAYSYDSPALDDRNKQELR